MLHISYSCQWISSMFGHAIIWYSPPSILFSSADLGCSFAIMYIWTSPFSLLYLFEIYVSSNWHTLLHLGILFFEFRLWTSRDITASSFFLVNIKSQIMIQAINLHVRWMCIKTTNSCWAWTWSVYFSLCIQGLILRVVDAISANCTNHLNSNLLEFLGS